MSRFQYKSGLYYRLYGIHTKQDIIFLKPASNFKVLQEQKVQGKAWLKCTTYCGLNTNYLAGFYSICKNSFLECQTPSDFLALSL